MPSNNISDIRVGVMTIADARKGLWRDAECLLWALTGEPVRRSGLRPRSVSLFSSPRFKRVERNLSQAAALESPVSVPQAVAKGTSLLEWLDRIDVLVVFEGMMRGLFELARKRGKRVILVPNMDMTRAYRGGGIEKWPQLARELGCEVWAKTPAVSRTLEKHGLSPHLVPWSIPDPVNRSRRARPNGRDILFVMNAGKGGWRRRRGVDLAIRAFKQARRSSPRIRLLVKSFRPLARLVPEDLLECEGLEIWEEFVERQKLAAVWDRADAVLYPSRWEGFGLSLLEALHEGLPVIATNGWPMSELVEHEHNGLLVKARQVGTARLAPHWECDVDALAAAMLRLAEDDDLRRRLTCPEPAELVARQHAFVMRVRQLVLREPVPRVVFFRSKSERAWRRSEEYWADALTAHGYDVDRGFNEDPPQKIRKLLADPHHFTLVSKCPEGTLRTIKEASGSPVVLWIDDLVDHNLSRMRWFSLVGPMVDLCCLPESGREDRFRALGANVCTLLPGAKVDGDRGPGKRPKHVEPAAYRPQVLFMGVVKPTEHRRKLIEAVAGRYPVDVYGSYKGSSSGNICTHSAVWSSQAASLIRSSGVVLSMSRGNGVGHYTSQRLFLCGGAGGCVVAEEYPGLKDHYPAGAVASFKTPEQAVETISGLMRNPSKAQEMRAVAEEWTWRHHTWNDRIHQLLLFVSAATRSLADGLGQGTAQNTGLMRSA